MRTATPKAHATLIDNLGQSIPVYLMRYRGEWRWYTVEDGEYTGFFALTKAKALGLAVANGWSDLTA